ncbi:hypothetical protein B0T16DRAFT_455861 [Cercophora newfieldiana]|uniref:Rhamnogalacturonase A/B/Epimerase-like pectate lyase domain-containing protein n=1 Tax=Cercophora newfieldiana TaxID=92897 RepID=A0AA39Y9U7_9PEZI|nr:hypothetical protein B0T16DRAFT_455861 [Cercophora newfieldiana]
MVHESHDDPILALLHNGVCRAPASGSPWIGLIDGKSINSGTIIKTETFPSFLIENLDKDTADDIVQGPQGYVLPGKAYLSRFSYPNTVSHNPIYAPITTDHTRPSSLTINGRYPYLPAPNYASTPISDFINIKDPSQNGGYTIHGDATHDDTSALTSALAYAASRNKIAYFPFGNYRISSTLLIPLNSTIIDEAWATITAAGHFWASPSDPKPIRIQDMRFTVLDVLPGAIILEIHAAGTNPGDIAIWNSLVTVGGVRSASGVTSSCTDSKKPCMAAAMGIHLPPTSSAYLENVWNWVADHIAEDIPGGGSNIAAGRGVLLESTKGTWIHALGSEHWWLYQLHMRTAEGVMVLMLQSETNYDQGDHAPVMPSKPWIPDATYDDPDFSWCTSSDGRCRMGVGNLVTGGKDIYTYASASWVFFSGPGRQGCAAGEYTCQEVVHWVQKPPENLNMFGMCSNNAKVTLRLGNGTEIVTKDGFTGGLARQWW